MQINYTFRNLDSSNALKEYAKDKVDRVNKYLDQASEAHIVCSLERHHHICDITIHAGPYSLRGRDKSEDFYSSVDMAMEKIERQLKRYKEKLKSHKGGEHHNLRELEALKITKVNYQVVSVPSPEDEAATADQVAKAAKPGAVAAAAPAPAEHKVIKSDEFQAKSLTVEEAIMHMDLMNNEFLVFTNVKTKDVNVVYRRKDGNYGLIETAARPG
jgi:putative sigma-54 modulation protein